MSNDKMSDNIALSDDNWLQYSKFRNPKFECPVHGITENVIQSTIPGHEGAWCNICWIDSLERLGVCRVMRVEEDEAER